MDLLGWTLKFNTVQPNLLNQVNLLQYYMIFVFWRMVFEIDNTSPDLEMQMIFVNWNTF